jgi:hypothetical protein
MQEINTSHASRATHPSSRNSLILVLALFILVLVAAYAVNANRALQANALPPGTVTISHDTLKEKYGVSVNLVAVTGAGGFVDVRMKIVNGEKAKLLLTDPKSFPALMIGDVILNAPEATKSQKMRFENNATMYIMYPNSGNVVTQGKTVTILFGDTALQPIEAK